MANSRSMFREFFDVFLIAILCALFVRTFLLQTFQIPSRSMEESLQIGDHIVVNKFIYSFAEEGLADGGPGRPFLPVRAIRRGDIAVFRVPSQDYRHFIKRCMGLPGETLEIAADRLLIDGRRIEEPYLHTSTAWRRSSFGPYRIPEGSYFFLGDHRDDSRDSRSWGAVPVQQIQARAMFVYWSFAVERPTALEEWSMINEFLEAFSRSRWGRYPRWIR